MNIWTAPFYSLFSLRFYRWVIASPLYRGFLYLLFTGVVVTFCVLLAFASQALPRIDEFAAWLVEEMPEITWTPQGITTQPAGPKTLVHPVLGPLVTFDTGASDVNEQTMGDVRVFVTATKLYLREEPRALRVYDLVSGGVEKRAGAGPVTLTRETAEKFYRMAKPWAMTVIVIFVFSFFYLWKVLAALFYSLIGLLINLARRERLRYAQILNVSFFALTPMVLLQLLSMTVPFLRTAQLGPLVSLVVTSVYLFIAVKLTEEKSATSPG